MDNGETILSGPVVDQTALHGVLIKIRDLGLPLLGLSHIEPEKEHESNLLMHTDAKVERLSGLSGSSSALTQAVRPVECLVCAYYSISGLR